jgi:hypothetical protein
MNGVGAKALAHPTAASARTDFILAKVGERR